MNLFHLYVFITLFFITILSIILAWKYRKALQHMPGMLISMYLGMNVGLTAGVLFGSIYQGNLFLSTILSMLIGFTAGAICGFVLGVLSWIEGVMAGIMGGMMGAMLGEMITFSQSSIMINIFLTLTISTLLLFFILPPRTNQNEIIKSKKWFLKPLLFFMGVSIYLIVGSQLDSALSQNVQHDSGHNHLDEHNNMTKENLYINVKHGMFEYTPNHFEIKKGQKITITLTNSDKIDHDFEIKDMSLKLEQPIDHSNHHETSASLHLHAKPHSKNSITFTPLKEGSFEFVCSITGHLENGMKGLLIVK